MTHNIGFSLGDWSCDGHCQYDKFHITCNYSAKEIEEAYKKVCDRLHYDFLKECREYKETRLSLDGYVILSSLRIIEPMENVDEENYGDVYCSYWVEGIDKFISIFFELVKQELPDLVWSDRDLNEEELYILDGAAYGLYD